MKKPFLHLVAEAYAKNEASNLDKYCFILPNRRSRTFFKEFLSKELLNTSAIFPEIITISDFIESQSQLAEAGRVEQLLLLYQCYEELANESHTEHLEIDQFLHMADMILNDFNDIDKYLVDPKELYSNIKNLHDIQTDFLSDEQRAAIKEFWGVEKTPSGQDKLFVQSSYFDMYGRMYDLYLRFQETLKRRGLIYSGLSYRQAAEKIKDTQLDEYTYSRYIFVGFSTLTKAEKQIFTHLRNVGIGDYYWDFDSAFLDEKNKGSYFLKGYVKEFQSLYNINDEIKHMPNIQILSVPSGSGQGLVVNSVLDELKNNNLLNPDDAIDTAIVLPEEKYVNSVLSSISDDFKNINVTMGLSVSQSSIASFLDGLAELDTRKRVINGEVHYFNEDLEMVISHPYSSLICGAEVIKFMKLIHKKNIYYVPISLLNNFSSSLSSLFGLDSESSVDYINRILNTIFNKLDDSNSNGIEKYFVAQFIQAFNQIQSILEDFKISIDKQSLFFLLSRSMNGAIVPFEGKPLKGLQIMGVLETRLLDFKNIIVLSLNEKIFPTKHYSKSFIPNGIRTAYGLSTFRYQDSMFAYYFFRMISRADNVFLLYDSRINTVSGGEESRYIKQIKQIYNRGNNKELHYEYNILAPDTETFGVNKTKRVRKILDRFRSNGDDAKYLSASSLNTYIRCPFKFYLQVIEGFKEEDELTDFIDSKTMGTIVHEILQEIYPVNSNVTRTFLEDYIKVKDNKLVGCKSDLEKVATSVINDKYNHLSADKQSSKLTGEAVLIGRIVLHFISNMLFYDWRQLASNHVLTYGDSEKEIKMKWDFGDGITMNFRGFIDRIDNLDGELRIIDYKTGADEMELKDPVDFDDLFNIDPKGKSKKAIFQLLLYCNAYRISENYKNDITPVINKIRDISTAQSGEYVIKINQGKGKEKKDLKKYNRDIDNDKFMMKVKELIEEIFNPKTPFNRNYINCNYCQFKKICETGEES